MEIHFNFPIIEVLLKVINYPLTNSACHNLSFPAILMKIQYAITKIPKQLSMPITTPNSS